MGTKRDQPHGVTASGVTRAVPRKVRLLAKAAKAAVAAGEEFETQPQLAGGWPQGRHEGPERPEPGRGGEGDPTRSPTDRPGKKGKTRRSPFGVRLAGQRSDRRAS